MEPRFLRTMGLSDWMVCFVLFENMKMDESGEYAMCYVGPGGFDSGFRIISTWPGYSRRGLDPLCLFFFLDWLEFIVSK